MKQVEISIPMPWGHISGKTFGEEGKIPVLCVHGRSDNMESFTQLIPLLPLNMYYVCIDLPGHGKSAQAGKGYILDIIWYTMCVKRVIDHFNWTKLYFIGHSLGGRIGLFLASIYPKLLLKVVVIDALLIEYVEPENTSRFLKKLIDSSLEFENRLNLANAPIYSLQEFLNKMKETRMTEVSYDQIKSMAERNLIKVGSDQYKYSNDQRIKILTTLNFSYDQLENIAKEVCCPTLVILGKNSLVTRLKNQLNSTPLHNNNNISLHVIEGDHDVHLARPETVASSITFFLSRECISKL